MHCNQHFFISNGNEDVVHNDNPTETYYPCCVLCVSAIDCTDFFMKSPEVLMAVFWLLSGSLFFLEPNVNIFGQ